MVDWKNILIGVVLTIVLGLTGIISSYAAPIIAAIYIGYVVGKDYKNGAIYGVEIGIIAAVVLSIVNVTMAYITYSALYALSADIILNMLANALVQNIIVFGIGGAIGGATGVAMKENAK
jgi:hypothetical protein